MKRLKLMSSQGKKTKLFLSPLTQKALLFKRNEDLICYCRTRGCKRRERLNGTCRKSHLMYTLCCH
uniref:Defensin, alpha, 27 n=1 Tax=Mus spicilegus TaxID=10103 RepID=A0A8C6MXK4_MUSSI